MNIIEILTSTFTYNSIKEAYLYMRLRPLLHHYLNIVKSKDLGYFKGKIKKNMVIFVRVVTE